MEDYGQQYENTVKEIRSMAKRLGLTIMVSGLHSKYTIRFTMKRRWGGARKYAYQCSLGTLAAYVAQIENSGGKIVGID